MVDIEQEVKKWIDSVVLGLGLCPFATKPFLNDQIRIFISQANSDFNLLCELEIELVKIDQLSAEQIESTLIVIPEHLNEFIEFNEFLNQVDYLLEQQNWLGRYQFASFHPRYQFAETDPNDPANLTNCAPYPILQILREESISKLKEQYDDMQSIPQRNIETMRSLTEKQQSDLFPYLFLNI